MRFKQAFRALNFAGFLQGFLLIFIVITSNQVTVGISFLNITGLIIIIIIYNFNEFIDTCTLLQ